MNKNVQKLIIIGLLSSSLLLDAVRTMSVGVAQRELKLMIQNAKKNPPSPEKIKQLLDDVSPSLREQYQEMIDEIDTTVRKKEVSVEEEKKETIDSVDIALSIISNQIKRGSSKEDAQSLAVKLVEDEGFKFNEVTAVRFMKMANNLIEKTFFKIEEKDGVDEEDGDKEKRQFTKELEEINRQEQKGGELRAKEIKLSKYITSFCDFFNLYFDKDSFKKTLKKTLKEKSFSGGIAELDESINTFFTSMMDYQDQVLWNKDNMKKAFEAFFIFIDQLSTQLKETRYSNPEQISALIVVIEKCFSMAWNNIRADLVKENGSLNAQYKAFITQFDFIKSLKKTNN